MTSVLAPAKNITLQGIAPDVIQSCVLAPPPPTPAPEPEDVIYAPVAPGITYGSLPVITTGTTPGNLVIVDTSPDQIIGCANDVGTDPQSRLNALFPSAVDGDGVVDRATNNIWVYDGATWNNVGPTPGPTLTVNSTIPPWNEILVYDARVRTRLEVNGLAYALELLTEPAAYGITLGMTVQTSQALVRVPAAGQSLAAQLPAVSSGASVLSPAAATTFTALVPQVSSGGAVIAPSTGMSFAVSMVPYVGPRATVIQPPDAAAGALTPLPPAVSSGASIATPVSDITTTAGVPIVSTKVPPVLSLPGSATAGGAAIFPGYSNVQTNDILLLVVETSGDGSNVTPLPGEPGWNVLSGTPLFDGDPTPAFGSKLHVWWYRATAPITSGSVTFSDSGDHQVGRVYLIRGCATTGDPFDVVGTATKTTPSTTASAPSVTTTVPQTLVVSMISQPVDSSITTQFSAPTNTGLTSLTDVDEVATNSFNGGGFVIASGIKRLPGATGTINYATAPNVRNASVVVAFKP